ncbi:hypothetical protein MRB53_034615 [Persea americana]|uniref:Uncharacterized protein n=1 Tax=Persea americana TaxID=3435 RepID=A0ACC2K2N4_PERAE|nr:hypothetical protein MRB53_034615 [Persea americana]
MGKKGRVEWDWCLGMGSDIGREGLGMAGVGEDVRVGIAGLGVGFSVGRVSGCLWGRAWMCLMEGLVATGRFGSGRVGVGRM